MICSRRLEETVEEAISPSASGARWEMVLSYRVLSYTLPVLYSARARGVPYLARAVAAKPLNGDDTCRRPSYRNALRDVLDVSPIYHFAEGTT